jgi:hypothetical protein
MFFVINLRPASQAECRGFSPGLPLQIINEVPREEKTVAAFLLTVTTLVLIHARRTRPIYRRVSPHTLIRQRHAAVTRRRFPRRDKD